jgi:Protein of unknown function (DUF3485)
MSTMALATKRLLKQPSFLVAFVVLLVAAVGLNAATQFMQLHFKKQPVPLARSLDNIPPALGTWMCVSKDQLADDVEQELGTNKYIMRYYVNTAVISSSDLVRFEGKDQKGRLEELAKLRAKYKAKADSAIISFAVTYYTGKADTVAHIPERCYTADGYEPTNAEERPWDLRDKQSPDGNLNVRYISFEDQAGTRRIMRNVAYLFHVNGAYTSDPTRVRIALQNLMQKYGYYSKVECMVESKDREAARESIQDFLRYALPEVEQCLPNWSKLPKK